MRWSGWAWGEDGGVVVDSVAVEVMKFLLFLRAQY